MGYFTTVKTLDSAGRPCKAEVVCGGKSRGFTDQRTGEMTFEMYSNSVYDVYAKRLFSKTRGKVRGGQAIVLRL